MVFKDGSFFFVPKEMPFLNLGFSLSQITDLESKSFTKFNLPTIRPFNRQELERILRVGVCLNCHEENSKVFMNWDKKRSHRRCPVFNF